MVKRFCLVLGILVFMIPLLSITLSIILSPWFSFFKNALSDLGHSTQSNVAPLFNLGLCSGGILLIIFGGVCVSSITNNKVIGLILALSGYFLTLIAVFDEIYGRLHYIISLLFFLSLALGTLTYAYTYKSFKALSMLFIGTAIWVLYFMKIIKCGIAIPELVSILVVLVWYIDLLREITKEVKKAS